MALTALLVASTMLSQDTYALLWKPKEGEKTVYEFYLDGLDGSVEASIEYVVSVPMIRAMATSVYDDTPTGYGRYLLSHSTWPSR